MPAKESRVLKVSNEKIADEARSRNSSYYKNDNSRLSEIFSFKVTPDQGQGDTASILTRAVAKSRTSQPVISSMTQVLDGDIRKT